MNVTLWGLNKWNVLFSTYDVGCKKIYIRNENGFRNTNIIVNIPKHIKYKN